MHSGSFDRAAHIYDETRGFPPGVGDLVAEAAEGLLAGRLAVLEIGVGTGRIARPLLARGVRVTGLDVSRKMMARLVQALPAGAAPPSLVQGAAEALPLASASFDAVLSVHVLHLIPAWQASLAEMRRVLLPGGVILSGYDWRPNDAPGARLMERWRQIVAERSSESIQSATGRGTHDFEDIKAELLANGPRFDEVMVGSWTTTRTLARNLEAIEHRTWSSTWNLPDDFFAACLAELRAWAIAEYGDLDREFATPHRFVWQRFEWPQP
jgi:ubiquinone/menaquinone biosynthesis C-methylase UbiE